MIKKLKRWWKKFKKNHKFEFSKFVVVWVLVLTTGTIVASYVLASQDLDPIEGLAETLVTSLAVIVVTYCVKSLGEKNSRNKYGVGENGTQKDPEK